MNIKMKHSLMLQSLSPLALLTIIRNFSFQMSVSEFSLNLATLDEFFRLNSVLIVVFIYVLHGFLPHYGRSFLYTAFKWTDKKKGYQLSSFEEKEDASLNFFMTLIIPLLIL